MLDIKSVKNVSTNYWTCTLMYVCSYFLIIPCSFPQASCLPVLLLPFGECWIQSSSTYLCSPPIFNFPSIFKFAMEDESIVHQTKPCQKTQSQFFRPANVPFFFTAQCAIRHIGGNVIARSSPAVKICYFSSLCEHKNSSSISPLHSPRDTCCSRLSLATIKSLLSGKGHLILCK